MREIIGGGGDSIIAEEEEKSRPRAFPEKKQKLKGKMAVVVSSPLSSDEQTRPKQGRNVTSGVVESYSA